MIAKNHYQLHNDLFDFLQNKNLGLYKENVLSAGKPFVVQLGDVLCKNVTRT